LFGRTLPAYRNISEARTSLFAARDARLAGFKVLASKSDLFVANDTPESLKQMEAWYFQLVESDGFRLVGVTREEFEKCMATYFCHVAVVNCPEAEWYVAEFAFEPGKYEIGVKRGLVHQMRGSFTDHFAKGANRRRTAIYREFQRYYSFE